LVENRYVGMKARGCAMRRPAAPLGAQGHRAIESITLTAVVALLPKTSDAEIRQYDLQRFPGWSP
jgi:argininosuccinate synthase